jgi:hypothetical protein
MNTKSLLLGSAAGLAVASLAAISGAQAADLPVKAKVAAQYVKVCSLYGKRFYYIPGTDTCVRIGGYIRADYHYNARGGGTPAWENGGGLHNGYQTLTDTSPYATRHRAILIVDTRSQSAYGTVRSLIQMGFSNENQQSSSGPSIYFARAFIQFAGFTFGRGVSPYTIYNCGSDCRYHTAQFSSSNAAGGANLAIYTAQFGGGLEGNVWIEEQRRDPVTLLDPIAGTGVPAIGGKADSKSTEQYPDFGLNLTLQQAWGHIGASIVGHNASGGYYGGTTVTGHPSSTLGWAAEVGGKFKLPWLGSRKDYFGIAFGYGHGATKYSGGNNLPNAVLFGSGNQLGLGYAMDGIYVPGGDVELTTSWNINTAVEHWWRPNLHTSLYYAMSNMSYSDAVKNTSLFCTANAQFAPTNCDPDWSGWEVGSRTQWEPVPNLELGLDVFYTHLDTAFSGTAALGKNGARPAGIYDVSDQGIVSTTFRVRKTF